MAELTVIVLFIACVLLTAFGVVGIVSPRLLNRIVQSLKRNEFVQSSGTGGWKRRHGMAMVFTAFLVLLAAGMMATITDDGGPRRSVDLALEIKLNCEQRVERAARQSVGRVEFANMFNSEVLFNADSTSFTWRSSFTTPDVFPATREHSFTCSGSGNGNSISNWRIDELDADF